MFQLLSILGHRYQRYLLPHLHPDYVGMDLYDTHAQDTQNKQLSELIDMRLSKLFHWFRKQA